MDNEEYKKKQVEGHKNTEKYALSTIGYFRLMRYLQSFIPKKGLILDVGCNSGYESMSIQSPQRRVIGIDIGKEFIKRSKSLGVDARLIDMHSLKFHRGYFDAIYCNNTLEHSHTPSKVLTEFHRVLKSGGILIICIPSDYKNTNYISNQGWDSSLHLWKPNLEEFRNLIVKCGFKNIEIEEIDAKLMFGLENRASLNYYVVVLCIK